MTVRVISAVVEVDTPHRPYVVVPSPAEDVPAASIRVDRVCLQVRADGYLRKATIDGVWTASDRPTGWRTLAIPGRPEELSAVATIPPWVFDLATEVAESLSS